MNGRLRTRGLITTYVFFVIQVKTRRVDIVGSTVSPNGLFMRQVAVDLVSFDDSFPDGYSHLIIDRDKKYTKQFVEILRDGVVDVVKIPAKSPNCDPHAERFVRSIKSECLSRLIFFGARSLRRAYTSFLTHYNRERPHQSLGNDLIETCNEKRAEVNSDRVTADDGPSWHTLELERSHGLYSSTIPSVEFLGDTITPERGRLEMRIIRLGRRQFRGGSWADRFSTALSVFVVCGVFATPQSTADQPLTLKGHTNRVYGVAFSPDGKKLASVSSDRTLKIWDATSGEESLTLKGHTHVVSSVAFSPDGKRLASTSFDKTVKVWDAISGAESLTLEGHTMGTYCVAFSPDGKRLVSASSDQTLKVWDATSGKELLTLKGHQGEVWSVVFSPDGELLASASLDKTVKVWDATSGEELLTVKGHTIYVMCVAFSPDGELLASGGGDQTVKVWDATSGLESLTLKGHSGVVRSVAFSPTDGKRLASGSADKSVKVWDITTRGQESGKK